MVGDMVEEVVVLQLAEDQVVLVAEEVDMELVQQDLQHHLDKEMMVDLHLHMLAAALAQQAVAVLAEWANQVLEMLLVVMVVLVFNFPQLSEIPHQVLDSQDHQELIGLQVEVVVEDIIQQVLALAVLVQQVVAHTLELEMVMLPMVMV
jgi:hypothetical protein